MRPVGAVSVSAVKKYTVGQKLWWVPPHRPYNQPQSDGYEVTVTKVGTRYVTAEAQSGETSIWKWTHTFFKGSGRENNHHQQAGRAFPSKEDHASFVVLNVAWRDMCKVADRKLQPHTNPPSNVTMGEIETIKAILEALA